jgi:hypothetical protein
VRAMERAAIGVGVMQLGDEDAVQTVALLPSALHGQEGLGAAGRAGGGAGGRR